ncbi:MAG: ABC transporter [Planctomycetaceae bacterium]|nr:ABC transporter [Planctomycetaceae bacterium]
MIELQNVTKLYGPVIGVNDVSLSLAPGAHGLLGPNGSGKTTFLNLIMGQLVPTMGRVRLFGRNPRTNTAALRAIGFCPGDEAMYSNVSGYDWVRYLTELHGLSVREASKRAQQTLARVGMTDAMHRPMGTYSRGMRQRTKIAQAIAHDPKFLILDEPFNGLDPIGRHDVIVLLRDWTRNGGSLLLASHILHEVEAISRSFLLICSGRLLASGTADEVNELLADVPNEITLRCTQPRRVAQHLLDLELADHVRVEGSDCLHASSHHPLAIYNELPRLATESDIEIHAICSADDSLQTLFDSLMRLHRGG